MPSTEHPPLPPGMDGFAVEKQDGTETYAVSQADAARLAGKRLPFIYALIRNKQVEVCHHPVHGKLVLVDSLWAALPDEVKQ